MTKATLIYNARLLDENTDSPGAVLIIDKVIRAVFEGYFTNEETVRAFAQGIIAEDGYSAGYKLELYDARGLTLTPAFIDLHVHMRYPGQTQKEDLESGLHAATAGGFGTVVAMPNTNPVVSSLDMAIKIREEAVKIGLSHLFQTVSITKDFDGKTISHLENLDKSIVPIISEDGRDVESSAVMLEAMRIASSKGIVVSCHCEDMTLDALAKPYRFKALELMKENDISPTDFSMADFESMDSTEAEKQIAIYYQIDEQLTKANRLLETAENVATERNLELARGVRCPIHIAHVSTAEAIYSIQRFKEDFPSLKITCEVTPHHLFFQGDSQPFIRALVNPPLREALDINELVLAIKNDMVDVIATDHAPHTIEDKNAGAPGFPGLETAYAACNTVLVKNYDISPRLLSKMMSANPARILSVNKGLLQAGYDADLTLVDPDEEWTVDSRLFCSKGKVSPFDGQTLIGKVKALFIDGRKVYER